MLKYLFIVTLPIIGFTASDSHSSGGPLDLIPPFVNVSILLSIIIWKFKGTVKKHFEDLSEEVSQTYDRAQNKEKEASLKLKEAENKLANAKKETEQIKSRSREEAQKFSENYKIEIDERVRKLKDDSHLRLKAEEKAMLNKINLEMINRVIGKTKQKIKENSSYRDKASSTLVGDIV